MKFIRKSYLLLFAFSLSYGSTEYITPSVGGDESFVVPGPSLEDLSENNISDSTIKTDLSKETSFSKAVAPITNNIDFCIAGLGAIALKYLKYPALKLLPELSLMYIGLKHNPSWVGIGAALYILGTEHLVSALSSLLEHPFAGSMLAIVSSAGAGFLMKSFADMRMEDRNYRRATFANLGPIMSYEETDECGCHTKISYANKDGNI